MTTQAQARGCYPHLIPANELTGSIVDALTAAPCTVAALAQRFGYSEDAIRNRLGALQLSERVHYKLVGVKGGAGYFYLWHLGPAPAAVSEVRQATVKSYAPVNRRNELDTYLFGPARSKP